MEKLGEDGFVRNPVGTGPMQLTENMSGDHYTVKATNSYWKNGLDGKPLPYVDTIVYRLLTDDAVRTLELRSGNIDINEEIFPKDFSVLQTNPELELVELPWITRAYAMAFNMESGPFASNLKLRQAAAYGIDREGIAKVLGYNVGYGPKGYRMPGMLGYDAKAPYHWLDVAKAKQLVTESGFPKGSEVALMTHNRTVDQQQSQIIKQQLDTVGLTTQVAVADRTANIKQREAGNFTFLALQYNQDNEPDKQFTMPFACKAAGNYTRYCNPEFDKLLTAGRTTLDPAKRQEIYAKASQIMYEDVPVTYLWAYPRAIGIRKLVKGYGPNTTGYNGTDFREVWLEK
jgi:ABC-type transport system substrate-binding protein